MVSGLQVQVSLFSDIRVSKRANLSVVLLIRVLLIKPSPIKENACNYLPVKCSAGKFRVCVTVTSIILTWSTNPQIHIENNKKSSKNYNSGLIGSSSV